MADLATNLDLLSASQASKEATANALFDAVSQATLFGRRARACDGLIFGVYGGVKAISGVPTKIANQNVTLTNNATNYLSETDGVVAVTTSLPASWPGPLAGNMQALYTITTSGGVVTNYVDWRSAGLTGPAGPAGAAGATGPAGADADTLFDVHAFYPGTIPSSAILLRIPVARACVFPDNFAGSYGTATVAATGSTVFDIKKNGTNVGTMTFSAAGTTAAFNTTGTTVSLVAGDILSVHGPASSDSTLANVGLVLAGDR